MLSVFVAALALGSSAPGGGFHCLTPELWPLPPVSVPVSSHFRVGAGLKQERDAFGAIPNVLTSANFALKWGNTSAIQSALAEEIIDLFEIAWAKEVVEMGHPAPKGTTTYLFNAYIGDTGDGTPPDRGAGGYYYVDDDGYPMIVIARRSAVTPKFVATVVAHEFYHALEHATGSFNTKAGRWYWEAAAEWVVPEVFPSAPYGEFLGGYATMPYLSLRFFDYPDSNAAREYHQYGAFIFPKYLTEHIADWRLVRDSWVDAGPKDDPLVVLDKKLSAWGSNLGDAFAGFAAANATWDYEDEALYRYNIESFERSFPSTSEYVVELSQAGSDGWVTPAAESLPSPLGYNIIQLALPNSGNLHVAFEGDRTCSRRTPIGFAPTVVRSHPSGREYVPVPVDKGVGSVDVPSVDLDSVLFLAVAAIPTDRHLGVPSETCGYRFQMWIDGESAETSIGVSGSTPGAGPGTTPGNSPSKPLDAPASNSDDADNQTDQVTERLSAIDGGCDCSAAVPAPSLVSLLIIGWINRRRRRC